MHLRDGSRLTAADVAATYASILDPAGASPHRALLDIIRDMRTDGSDQIEFRLAKPDPLFPAYLGIGILPAALIRDGHPFQREPVGSGPFQFLDWSEPGWLHLERRCDHHRFELLAVKDSNVRVMKLLRGEVHLLQNDLAPELLDYLQGRPEVRVRSAGPIFPTSASTSRTRLPVCSRCVGPSPRPSPRPSTGGRSCGFCPCWPSRVRSRATLASDPFRVRLATVIQAQLARVGI